MAGSDTDKLGREPRYVINHAAELIRAHPTTVRAWFKGIQFSKRPPFLPVLALDNPEVEPITLSFFNLVEAGFVAAYRSRKISMQRIRDALRFSEETLKIDRPLLTESFRVIGKKILVDHFGDLFEVSGPAGQRVWPELVEEYFDSVVFSVSGPTQYWLLGRHRGCVAMPRIAFGEPVVPRGGVRIEVIHSRFHGGEGFKEIATDLSLSTEEVEEAVRCGDLILKQAA